MRILLARLSAPAKEPIRPRPARPPRLAAALAAAILTAAATGCSTRARELVQQRGVEVVQPTDPSRSMVSLLRTEAGVVVVDLGWWGAADELESTLEAAGADSVVAVFVTHGHRDHIAAWPAVRRATFYMAAAEAPYFFGEADYAGWIPRLADRLLEPPRPHRDSTRLVTFSSDTAVVFGRDTVRAFLVPGHTAGSAAYLARGILFAGDAISHTTLSGYRAALPGYSDDTARAAASLRDLFKRLEDHDVRVVCTAHAQCAEFDEAFRRDVFGPDAPEP